MSTVRVSNCGHDENDYYMDGQAGDQTNTEWRLQDWYSYPWNYVVRWLDKDLAELFATLAIEAAENDMVGYDQNQRDTFWEQLKVSGYRPSKITVPCEADCSSGVSSLIKAVGYLTGNKDLQDISPLHNTGSLADYFVSSVGKKYFVLLTGKVLTDPSIAYKGDINLNTGCHTCITVDTGGSYRTFPYPVSTLPPLNVIKNYLTRNDCYNSGRRITPIGMQLHTIGCAQDDPLALASGWNTLGVEACVHYCVSAMKEGEVYNFLPDNFRSWGDGGFGNNNLITVELMESDHMVYTGGANYRITDYDKFIADIKRAYNTAVQFFAYKCKENKWNPTEKLSNGLYRVSSHDEGRRLGLSTAHVDPTHLWPQINKTMDDFRSDVASAMNGFDPTFEEEKWYRVRKSWEDEKSQIGAYTYLENAKNNCPTGYSVYDSDGNQVYTNGSVTSGTQATAFTNLTNEQAAIKLLEMAKVDYEKTGILASVTAAQAILESGYASTELAIHANNLFGMKTELSGNTWSNSTWDGKSKYTKVTQEEYSPGEITDVIADFRKYPNIEDSIGDHSAYLLGAMNGSKLRYDGLKGCTNYRKAITIVKNGGYATDSQYIEKICDIIERYKLDRYDNTDDAASTPPTDVPDSEKFYRVGTGWDNGCVNQTNAYTNLDNAKKEADRQSASNKKIYNVYDWNGNCVYTEKYNALAFVPYNVKVVISDLRIRKTPNGEILGFINKGVYGITAEEITGGHTWGRLKSGAGWIALDEGFITKL